MVDLYSSLRAQTLTLFFLTEVDKNGNQDALRFPPFHQEILHQNHWDAAESLGRIKVVIAEGCSRPHRTPPFERVRDVLIFSFQHAPLRTSPMFSTVFKPNTECPCDRYPGILRHSLAKPGDVDPGTTPQRLQCSACKRTVGPEGKGERRCARALSKPPVNEFREYASQRQWQWFLRNALPALVLSKSHATSGHSVAHGPRAGSGAISCLSHFGSFYRRISCQSWSFDETRWTLKPRRCTDA